MSDRFGKAPLVAIVMVIGSLTSVSLAQSFVVWMDPNGVDAPNDPNAGLDEGHPVKTLGRVQTILRDELRDNHRNAEVRIKAGTYVNDPNDPNDLKWKFFMPEHEIKFMCWPDVSPRVRPVFKSVDPNNPSQGLGGTWFTLAIDDGQPTNLTFWYLRVEHYDMAINFDGSRVCHAWNGYNTVYGCYFYEIGNLYTKLTYEEELDVQKSTACLRLHNSRNNVITNNHFVYIESEHPQSYRYNHIHALYLANYSSENTISENRFVSCMGDPVKVRNASNWNRVTENRFIGCGILAAVTDWFCVCPNDEDCDAVGRCNECRSWENRVYSNILDGNYGCTAALWSWCVWVKDPNHVGDCRYEPDDPLFVADGNDCPPPDPNSNCVSSVGCGLPGAPHRFHTWDNITMDVPCSSECLGDMTCDGLVNYADISPFVQYLSNITAWQSAYPGCAPRNGDINQDSIYPSFDDINPFVVLLSSTTLPIVCP